MRRRVGWLLAVAVLVLTACSSTTSGLATASDRSSQGSDATGGAELLIADQPRAPGAEPQRAAAAMTGFTARLLATLPREGNLVVSPYSIYAVLAMARAGAQGQTAAQLDAVLGSADAADAGALVTAVDTALEAAQRQPDEEDRAVAVDVANSLWIQAGLPVQSTYLDQLATGFGAGVYTTDYAADAEQSRNDINAWVSERTHDLIPELIAAEALSPSTLLTLVNAVYFAGSWPDDMLDAGALPFSTLDGEVSAAAMRTQRTFDYAQGDGWQSVTLPYVGGGMAMTLIVPDLGSFASVTLDEALMAAATAGESRPVLVTMPKFDTTSSLDLTDPMIALGLTDLFSAQADLSAIAGPDHPLMATDMVQQAVIAVDEHGTVAAAATAMMGAGSAAPSNEPVTLTVDRPFYYLIHDTVTNAPLFVGRVLDPTA